MFVFVKICFVSFFYYLFSKNIYHSILKVNLSEQNTGTKIFKNVGSLVYMLPLREDPLDYSLSKKRGKKEGREGRKAEGGREGGKCDNPRK